MKRRRRPKITGAGSHLNSEEAHYSRGRGSVNPGFRPSCIRADLVRQRRFVTEVSLPWIGEIC